MQRDNTSGGSSAATRSSPQSGTGTAGGTGKKPKQYTDWGASPDSKSTKGPDPKQPH